MKLLSVNRRDAAETIAWSEQSVQSGINKRPVAGLVAVGPEGLDGDVIVDKRFHGGEFKAVYSYAAEHYAFWREVLETDDVPFGMFGENLTTEGLDEDSLCIGDRLKIGSVVLQVTEPRQPCRVLGMNFKDMTMVKRFLATGKMGIYYKVIEAGTLQAGDAIEIAHRDTDAVPVSEITRLHKFDKDDKLGLARVLSAALLPPEWRGIFENQLAK